MSEKTKEIEIREPETDQEDDTPKCDDFRCPVQQFEEDGDEDPYVSHIFVMRCGTVFFANKSIELEATLPNGDVEILVAMDVLHYPEDDDRSIITCSKSRIDYTQEFYNKESWNELMRAAFCTKCEQMAHYHRESTMFG